MICAKVIAGIPIALTIVAASSCARPSPSIGDWDRIEAQNEARRLQEARKLGLPDRVSWDVILEAENKIMRISRARSAGLHDDATWEQIISAEIENTVRGTEVQGVPKAPAQSPPSPH